MQMPLAQVTSTTGSFSLVAPGRRNNAGGFVPKNHFCNKSGPHGKQFYRRQQQQGTSAQERFWGGYFLGFQVGNPKT